MQAPMERGSMASTHSWPWLYMGVNGERHAPAALYPPGENPGTHWIRGWMGLRAGLDTEAREKSFTSTGDWTPIVQSVVRHATEKNPSPLRGLNPDRPVCSQSLYWLRYVSSWQETGKELNFYAVVLSFFALWCKLPVSHTFSCLPS
jgi:hypothetical protein